MGIQKETGSGLMASFLDIKTMTISSQPHILIVEDDKELAQWTGDYLSTKGFRISMVNLGQEAIDFVNDSPPDLILLDGMLPDVDGLDVCKAIRPIFTGPILMLTARDEEIDEVLGLEVGADDYLTKPVRARALLARIRIHLNRQKQSTPLQPATSPLTRVVLSGLVVDCESRAVLLNEKQISVTSNEFDLIWLLAKKAGTVVSRDELVSELRGIDYDGFDRSIDLRISRIRKKLGDNSTEPERIKTIWGKGYLFTKDKW